MVVTKTVTSLPRRGGLFQGRKSSFSDEELQFEFEDLNNTSTTQEEIGLEKRQTAEDDASSRHLCPVCPMGAAVLPNAPFVAGAVYCW